MGKANDKTEMPLNILFKVVNFKNALNVFQSQILSYFKIISKIL